MRTSLVKKDRVEYTRICVDVTLWKPSSTTRPKCDGPWAEFHAESRATRAVGGAERFLIVSFKCEKGDKISPPVQVNAWLEYHTKNPFPLGGHRYHYLTTTESQLKGGKVIFFREDQDWTASKLLEHFGDLIPVYETSGPGKYFARAGLSFSSTALYGPVDNIVKIDDIKTLDGSVSTDGCGLLCESLAADICTRMKLPDDTCVFQIRLGGIKGVLIRVPNDVFAEICRKAGVPTWKTARIAYRPSMKKYDGGPQDLEIQDISRAPRNSRARLNKHFILLLLTIGVPLKVFEDLLEAQLDTLAKMLYDRDAALYALDGELDADGKVSIKNVIYTMLLAGHNLSEPHVRVLLERCLKVRYSTLREKLAISVKNSSYLFGVADPTGTLEEGQVYVNLPSRGGPQIGSILIGRNPAYDPSDLRVLEGVNAKKLSYLTNCVVFSAKGKHSVTDYMGGGDLDGDQYMVITEDRLIPTPEQSSKFQPKSRQPSTAAKVTHMPPKPSAPKTRSRAASNQPQLPAKLVKDSVSLFVEHWDNIHLLGSLSTAWLEEAQKTEQLSSSEICKEYAELVEEALDMTKAGGHAASIRQKGHNLRKQRTDSRLDSNPLEVLKDKVPDPESTKQLDFDCDPDLDCRNLTSSEDWASRKTEARRLMEEYNQGLKRAIRADERTAEEGRGSSKKPNFSVNEKEADIFKQRFVEYHFPATRDFIFELPRQALKASVWYIVGYEERKPSFAWLGLPGLNWLKSCASNNGRFPLCVGSSHPPARTLPSFSGETDAARRDHQVRPNVPEPGTSRSRRRSRTPIRSRVTEADESSSDSESSDYIDAEEDLSDIFPGDSASQQDIDASTASGGTTSFPTFRASSSATLPDRLGRLRLDDDDSTTVVGSGSRVRQHDIELYREDTLKLTIIRRDECCDLSRRAAEREAANSHPPASATSSTPSVPETVTSPVQTPTPSSSSQTKGKPQAPVMPVARSCSVTAAHLWKILNANGVVRAYRCERCEYVRKEKKDDQSPLGWRVYA